MKPVMNDNPHLETAPESTRIDIDDVALNAWERKFDASAQQIGDAPARGLP